MYLYILVCMHVLLVYIVIDSLHASNYTGHY
jgi:hypothetical protein